MQRSQTELTALTRKGSIQQMQDPDSIRKERTDMDIRRTTVQGIGRGGNMELRRPSMAPGNVPSKPMFGKKM